MKFKVWDDNQEQWDAASIDPATEIDAETPDAAAEKYARQKYESNYCECIVQGPDGRYRTFSLHHDWCITKRAPTTLEELCAP